MLNFVPAYYSDNSPENLHSRILINNDIFNISVSNPANFKGYTIYQNDITGISSLLILKDEKGNILHQTYLLFDAPKKSNEPFTANYKIPETHYQVNAVLYTDYDEKLKQSRSWYLKKPKMIVKIKYLLSRPEAEGKLFLNQSFNFYNKTLTFAEAKYWSSYIVSVDYGYPIILIGFIICVSALFVIYFLGIVKNTEVKTQNTDNRIQKSENKKEKDLKTGHRSQNE